MTNRFLIGIAIALIILSAWLLFKTFSVEGNNYDLQNKYQLLLDSNKRLQQDSVDNAYEQARLQSQLDSITKVKSKISYRYEKDIDTIYSMPDSIVFGLLAKHLDSLYVHRFSKFVTK